MNPEELYLHAIVNRHRASSHPRFPQLERLLHSWGGQYLESISVSGSHAKSTALRDSDLDLFLSLAPDMPGPLSAIHTSLAAYLFHYSPQPRNVSVRIMIGSASVDLIPARRRPDSTLHTLWQVRHNTWLQTDVAEQTRHVRDSGLIDEILALKIWSRRHALRFPSFAQELAVIDALTPNRPIAESFRALLSFLATGFPAARLFDPANSNNVVSDTLTLDQKHRIAGAARSSLAARSWPEIL